MTPKWAELVQKAEDHLVTVFTAEGQPHHKLMAACAISIVDALLEIRNAIPREPIQIDLGEGRLR